MKRGTLFLSTILLSFPLLVSCENAIPGRLAILGGNMAYQQRRYTEAIASYLRASMYKELLPYADYGLGSVYLALGELSSALERFSEAEEVLTAQGTARSSGSIKELLYRIRYNKALCRFQGEDYEGAAKGFRSALEVDGERRAAKRNLELSLLYLSRKAAPSAQSAPFESRQESGAAKTLFDYIREKESDRWKSRSESAPSSNSVDY